jgi:O-antigen/teichoic acid export membrane protein
MLKSRLMTRVAYGAGEASNALTLLLFAVLARMLGLEPYGELVGILAVAGILGTAMEFGFHTLLTRSVARKPEAAWPALTGAMLRQSALALPMLGVLYGYMQLADISPETQVAGLLIGASVWVRSLKETCRGVCRGLTRFDVEAVFLWTERASLLGICALALTLGGGLTAVGMVFLIVRVVDFTVFLMALRRLVGATAAVRVLPTATWLAAIPFAVSNVLFIVYYQVDTAMLSVLSTARDTGLYGAVYRFVDLLQVLPRLLIVVAFPAMAVAWVSHRERFQELLGSLQQVLTCVALPVLFATLVWSEPLVRWAFGQDYAIGYPALRLLALGNYFAFQSLLLAQGLQASAHERLLAKVLAGTVALNILLNALFIPVYGFLGAAVATAITELAYCAALVMSARRVRTTSGFPMGALELAGAVVLGSVLLTAGTVWMLPTSLAFLLVWSILLVRVRPQRLLSEWRR